MRIERITISMDSKVTENFNSSRQSISLTAELESGDTLEAVEEKLYEHCRAYLDKHGANGNGKNGTKTATNGGGVSAPPAAPIIPDAKPTTPPQPAPQQPPVKPEPKHVTNEKTDIWNDKRHKPWDDRNRSVQQLTAELKVRSANHAGFLRRQDAISYKEWRALHDHFNMKEIAEHEQADFSCGDR